MKLKIFFFLFCVFAIQLLFGQTIVGGSGVCVVDANPNTIADLQNQDSKYDCMLSFDNTNKVWYSYDDSTNPKWRETSVSLGSDDQIITNLSLGGSVLTITLENGNTKTVELSTLNTDNQNLSLLANSLILQNGGSVDLAPYLDNTDNQTITSFSLNNTTHILSLTLENGNTKTVDLTGLVNTDNQALSIVNNVLTLQNGGTVDLTPYLDNTNLTDAEISAMGYIKDYTVTQNDVTQHETALSITESQISDLNHTVDTDTHLTDTDISNLGYIKTFTETDPTVGTHIKNITQSDITSWNNDNDATNEIQTISKSGLTITLSNGGGSVHDNNTQLTEFDVDNYVSNNGYSTGPHTIDTHISDAEITALGYIKSPNDADFDPTNEFQTLNITGNDLSISDGNTITLPSSGGSMLDWKYVHVLQFTDETKWCIPNTTKGWLYNREASNEADMLLNGYAAMSGTDLTGATIDSVIITGRLASITNVTNLKFAIADVPTSGAITMNGTNPFTSGNLYATLNTNVNRFSTYVGYTVTNGIIIIGTQLAGSYSNIYGYYNITVKYHY